MYQLILVVLISLFPVGSFAGGPGMLFNSGGSAPITNLFTNGYFDSNSVGWTYINNTGGGWSAGAHVMIQNENVMLFQEIATTPSQTYNYRFTITAVANVNNGVQFCSDDISVCTTARTTTGTFSGTFVAGNSGVTGLAVFGGTSGESYTIDSIEVWQ